MKMNSEEKVGAFLVATSLTVLAAAVFGWGWNVLKIISMGFDPLTGLAVVRVIGVFVPPLGAIVGYL